MTETVGYSELSPTSAHREFPSFPSNALGPGQCEFWEGPESSPLKACDSVLGSFLFTGDLGKRSRELQRVGATSLFRNQRSGENHAFLLEYNIFSVVRDVNLLPPTSPGPAGLSEGLFNLVSSTLPSRVLLQPQYPNILNSFLSQKLCTAVPSAWDVLPHSVRLSLIKLQLLESGWEWAKERSLCPDLAVPKGLKHEFS